MQKTYYLFNPGKLSRKDNTLKFTPVDADGNENAPKYIPVEGVEDLYIFGELNANTALYNFLGKCGINVHFFDYYENYTGSFMSKDSMLAGKMLINQVQHYSSHSKRLSIAQQFIEGAGFNILKNLRYYNSRGKDTQPMIEIIERYRDGIEKSKKINELMGIEGNIRNIYYEAFNLIIDGFEFDKRSKQPPNNEVNALMSFGNMMCYAQCLRTIHQTQLNPTVSYLHEPGERRYSLALDIAEIFKPILVDRVIFKVLNKKEITKKDFDHKLNSVLLNEKGKKTFIGAFENRLNETIEHRTLKRKVSYKHLVKLECYKLQKHLLGIEDYKPFKIWW